MSYNQNKSCVTLNSMETVTKWTDNSTAQPLQILTIIYPPFLTYTEWNTTDGIKTLLNYQFCGPLIVLLECFAQHINTELELFSIADIGIIWGNYINEGKHPHIMVFPFIPLSFLDGLIGDEYQLSRYVWGTDGDAFFSKTLKLEQPMFAYLHCWDSWLYIGIFLSLLTISLVSALYQRSWSGVFSSMWNYSTILMSDTMTEIVETFAERVMTAVWLIVNTVLLSILSGQLYEFIINGKMIDRIESRVDLFTKANWKNSKIYIPGAETADYMYVETANNDPMAVDFLKRFDFTNQLVYDFGDDYQDEIIKTVLQENSVFIVNRLSLTYLLRLGEKRLPELFDVLTEGVDYYISKSERTGIPYYLIFLRQFFPEEMAVKFNKIICRLQESGLIDFETRMSSIPRGFGPRVDWEPEIPGELKLKPIAMYNIIGVLVLLGAGILISLLTFVLELIYYLTNEE